MACRRLSASLLLVFSLLRLPAAASGCSTVVFPTGEAGSIAIGRTMEYSMPSSAYRLAVRPPWWRIATHPFCRLAGAPSSDGGFAGPLGFASIDLLGSVMEGMNQEGLSVSVQILQLSHYTGPLPGANTTLCYPDVAAWLLANFATVGEAVAAMRRIAVIPQLPVGSTGLHWSIADASGAAVAAEYVVGNLTYTRRTSAHLKVYELGETGVMSNDPGFDWHLRNVKKFGLGDPSAPSPMSACPRTLLDSIPGDVSPPARFVRLAYLRQQVMQHGAPASAEEAVTASGQVVGNVYIPPGTVAPNGVLEPYERTGWTVFKLMARRMFLFKTEEDWQLRLVDVGSIPWESVAAAVETPLPPGEGPAPVRNWARPGSGAAPMPHAAPRCASARQPRAHAGPPGGSVVSVPIGGSAGARGVVVGHNVDWAADEQAGSVLAVHLKDEARPARRACGCGPPPAQGDPAPTGWTSRLGFVAVERGDGAVVAGVNSAGLAVSAVRWHPFPAGATPRRGVVLCIDDVAAWLLGTCGTAAEAAAAVGRIALVGPGGAHWAVHDAGGGSIVVEYDWGLEETAGDGAVQVHENGTETTGVLTGGDTDGEYFFWHLTNVDNYAGVSQEHPRPTLTVATELGPKPRVLSHGGNLLGLPAGYGDDDRFIRLFYLRLYAMNARTRAIDAAKSLAGRAAHVDAADPNSTDDAGVNMVSGLLANVVIPNGTAELGHATAMAVVTLPHRRRLMYRVGGDSRWHFVDLATAGGGAALVAPLERAPLLGAVNVTGALVRPAAGAPAAAAACCPCPASLLLGGGRTVCPTGAPPRPVEGCDGCRCCTSG